MAEKRISELTAKGSNLQSTDLIEVSVLAGGGAYNTRYITGAQITGAVSSVNLYNSNGTLTGNRTVTGGGYSITFTGQSTYRVVSPSASSLDTAFSVRNNTDTADLLYVTGAGVVRADAGFFSIGVNYLETIASPFFLTPKIEIISGIQYTSRGEFGFAYTSHDFKTHDLITTSGAYIMKVRNFNTLHFAVDKDGQIEMPNVQVGNAGLSAGDIYFDTAANILANGDLVCGRKV